MERLDLLASMGMDRTDPAAGGWAADTMSSVQQFAVPADQLNSESSILGGGNGSVGPRTPGTDSSGRGSPRGHAWEGVSTPQRHGRGLTWQSRVVRDGNVF